MSAMPSFVHSTLKVDANADASLQGMRSVAVRVCSRQGVCAYPFLWFFFDWLC
jgi:hypothetical protein